MTWRNLLKHTLAFLIAALCSGLIMIGTPVVHEFFQDPVQFVRRDTFDFAFIASLFMGLFHVKMGGMLSVIIGVLIGWRLKLLQPWFAALWGVLTLVSINYLFRNELSLHLIVLSVLSGFFSGLVYWWFAVRPSLYEAR